MGLGKGLGNGLVKWLGKRSGKGLGKSCTPHSHQAYATRLVVDQIHEPVETHIPMVASDQLSIPDTDLSLAFPKLHARWARQSSHGQPEGVENEKQAQESVSVPATEESHLFAHDFGPVPAKVFTKQVPKKGSLPRKLESIEVVSRAPEDFKRP